MQRLGLGVAELMYDIAIGSKVIENEDEDKILDDVPVGNKNLHLDFTILHPQRRLLVLEVKDWKMDTIHDANRKSFTVTIESQIL